MTSSTSAAEVETTTTHLRRALQREGFQYEGGVFEGGSVDDEGEDRSWMARRTALFVFLLTFSILTTLVFILLAYRERVWRRWGWDLLGRRHFSSNPSSSTTRRRRDDQLTADEIAAHELQQQLNDEVREQERMAKREERKQWYITFLKPYTTVAEEKDFFYSNDATSAELVKPAKVPKAELDKSKSRSMTETTITSISGEFTDMDMDIDDVDDIETTSEFFTAAAANKSKDAAEASSTEEDTNDEEEEQGHLCLHLPARVPDGPPQTVDAHCSICLGEYEPKERVVWSYSESSCRHAFHEECILPWLAKGKKRCPMCRHWFVPATKISDQKKELEARLAREAAAAAEATTSEDSTSTTAMVCTTIESGVESPPPAATAEDDPNNTSTGSEDLPDADISLILGGGSADNATEPATDNAESQLDEQQQSGMVIPLPTPQPNNDASDQV